MRLFALLVVSVLVATSAWAQPLQIESATVADGMRAATGDVTTVRLSVRIQNTGRVDRFAYATAQLDGGAETARVASTERIPSGASTRLTVPIVVDLRDGSSPDAINATVRVYSNATTVADTRTVPIPVEGSSPPPQTVIAMTEMAVDLPAPSEPTANAVSVRFTTGRDDRRGNTPVYIEVLDADGNALSAGPEYHGGLRITRSMRSGQEESYTIPLVRDVRLSEIHRLTVHTFTAGVGSEDNWDLEALEVRAAGRTLLTAHGAPLNRFTRKVQARAFQVAPPLPSQRTSALGLRILSGGDGMRGGGRVTAQVFDRSERPLSDAVDLATGNATWDEDGLVIAPVPLRRRVTVGEIGSVVVEHRSVQSGPFDTSDNWEVAMVEVLSGRPDAVLRADRQGPPPLFLHTPYSILHTAVGTPILHRFSDGSRQFRLTLP